MVAKQGAACGTQAVTEPLAGHGRRLTEEVLPKNIIIVLLFVFVFFLFC